MQILNRDQVIMIDVDGTLIRDAHNAEEVCVTAIPHPYRGNSPVHKVKLNSNINLLKDMHTRGRCIIVWSAAGHQWAQAVVQALNLENFVDFVMEKPIAYIDDLHAVDFMGPRIFLQD